MVGQKGIVSRRLLLLAGVSGLAAGLLLPTDEAAAATADEKVVMGAASDALDAARRGGNAGAKFKGILAEYANVPTVALFALGPFRSRLPADERSEYYNLVSNFIARLFAENISSFRGERFEVIPGTTGGLVRGNIVFASGRRSPLEWRVRNGKIVDLKVSGVWLSLHMRSQFVGILNRSRGSFDALFRYLKTGRA